MVYESLYAGTKGWLAGWSSARALLLLRYSTLDSDVFRVSLFSTGASACSQPPLKIGTSTPDANTSYHGNGGGGGSSGVVGDIGTPTARMMSSKNDDGDDYNDDGIGREKDIIGSTISSKSLKVKVCCKTWK